MVFLIWLCRGRRYDESTLTIEEDSPGFLKLRSKEEKVVNKRRHWYVKVNDCLSDKAWKKQHKSSFLTFRGSQRSSQKPSERNSLRTLVSCSTPSLPRPSEWFTFQAALRPVRVYTNTIWILGCDFYQNPGGLRPKQMFFVLLGFCEHWTLRFLLSVNFS